MEQEHHPGLAWACWAEDLCLELPLDPLQPQLPVWVLLPCSGAISVGLTGYWQLAVLPSAALAHTTRVLHHPWGYI